jgi:hypothetical protein
LRVISPHSGRVLYRVSAGKADSLLKQGAAIRSSETNLQLRPRQTSDVSESSVEAMALWGAGIDAFSVNPECTFSELLQYCRQANAYRRGAL